MKPGLANKMALYTSIAIIVSSSVTFGLWFKNKQLSFAFPELVNFYPKTWYFVSIFETVLIFTTIWLVLLLTGWLLGGRRVSLGNNLLKSALTFTPFLLSGFNLKLSAQCLFFFFFVTIFLAHNFFKNFSNLDKPKKTTLLFFKNFSNLDKSKKTILALISFFFIFFFGFPSFSPLYHTSFFDSWGRVDYLMNLEHQWENAKAYEFLGNFTQTGRLGGYTQAQFGISELSSLVNLFFDTPLVDYLSLYSSIKFMWFGLFILGTWGFFLFLYFGLNLSLLVSFIGGLGYLFGNASFTVWFEWTYYNTFPVYIFLPWVFLFIKTAYSSPKKILLLCAAGLAASLIEYIQNSHPENELLFIIC